LASPPPPSSAERPDITYWSKDNSMTKTALKATLKGADGEELDDAGFKLLDDQAVLLAEALFDPTRQFKQQPYMDIACKLLAKHHQGFWLCDQQWQQRLYFHGLHSEMRRRVDGEGEKQPRPPTKKSRGRSSSQAAEVKPTLKRVKAEHRASSSTPTLAKMPLAKPESSEEEGGNDVDDEGIEGVSCLLRADKKLGTSSALILPLLPPPAFTPCRRLCLGCTRGEHFHFEPHHPPSSSILPTLPPPPEPSSP